MGLMRNPAIAAIVLLSFQSCVAADLVLTVDGPIDVTAGLSSSESLLQISNASGAVAELMSGWQVSFGIVPIGSATGSVQIVPSAFPPADYALGSTGGGLSVFDSGDFTIYGDDQGANIPLPDAIPVAPNAMMNLMGFTVVASPDASGTFELNAFDGQTGAASSARTFWLNDSFAIQRYIDVTRGGGNVRLATVTVSAVPEPSAMLLMGIVGVGVFVMRRGS